jgi:hypothetical protein
MEIETIREVVGWTAVAMAYILFATLIDQIRLNLQGKPCSILVPIGFTVNCCFWVAYSLLKETTDWQMFSANLAGVIMNILTFITVIIGRKKQAAKT